MACLPVRAVSCKEFLVVVKLLQYHPHFGRVFRRLSEELLEPRCLEGVIAVELTHSLRSPDQDVSPLLFRTQKLRLQILQIVPSEVVQELVHIDLAIHILGINLHQKVCREIIRVNALRDKLQLHEVALNVSLGQNIGPVSVKVDKSLVHTIEYLIQTVLDVLSYHALCHVSLLLCPAILLLSPPLPPPQLGAGPSGGAAELSRVCGAHNMLSPLIRRLSERGVSLHQTLPIHPIHG
mmetsp:Transcript_35242/g.85107  ORF Transcript_35242/g.85107 Transcript_35242/m.85107 type:complete len:237 (-) Transcript_35242:173-883(-)